MASSDPTVVFVDDGEKNVAGARAAGMRAVHFVEPIDLSAGLRSHGIRLREGRAPVRPRA